jgi:hypothetical protein
MIASNINIHSLHGFGNYNSYTAIGQTFSLDLLIVAATTSQKLTLEFDSTTTMDIWNFSPDTKRAKKYQQLPKNCFTVILRHNGVSTPLSSIPVNNQITIKTILAELLKEKLVFLS